MERFRDYIDTLFNLEIFETGRLVITLYNLLLALVVFIATIFLLKGIKRIFRNLTTRKVMGAGTTYSIYRMIKYTIWAIVIILLIDSFGFNVSILIASAAALLFGVGLGLQKLFNDVASGIIMLIERSVKINDVVELESQMIGRVVAIGLRTSKIQTRDNIITIVPNSNLVNDKVVNWSHIERKTRFFVDVSVRYGSDVELVTSVLLECAREHPLILNMPGPFVRFTDFADSSLDFQLFFWTNESFVVENTKSDLRYRIDKAFRENGIEIPFPQRDLYLKYLPPDFRSGSK